MVGILLVLLSLTKLTVVGDSSLSAKEPCNRTATRAPSLTPLMSRKIHTLSQTAAFFSLRAQKPARQTCERVSNFFPDVTLWKRRFPTLAPKRRGKAAGFCGLANACGGRFLSQRYDQLTKCSGRRREKG